MNFHQIFIEIATAPTIPMDSFETLYTCYLGQSSHLFIFVKFGFFYFLRIFIKFSLKSLLLLQVPMDSFETKYTYRA